MKSPPVGMPQPDRFLESHVPVFGLVRPGKAQLGGQCCFSAATKYLHTFTVL